MNGYGARRDGVSAPSGGDSLSEHPTAMKASSQRSSFSRGLSDCVFDSNVPSPQAEVDVVQIIVIIKYI